MDDQEYFELAMEKWRGLHADGAYSVSPKDGVRAYIYSTDGWISRPDEPEKAMHQAAYYEREAEALAEYHERVIGGKALVLEGITFGNIDRVLRDRSVSDIVMIGDGMFSSIYANSSPDNEQNSISWRHFSAMSDHLKTGMFIQRTCGMFSIDLNVPVGAFAMRRHSSLYGPINKVFAPEDTRSYGDLLREEGKIVQVYPYDTLTIEYIRNNYAPKLLYKERAH